MQISRFTPQQLNIKNKSISDFSSHSVSSPSVSFGTKAPSKIFEPLKKTMQPVKNGYNGVTDKIAEGIVKFLHLKSVKGLVQKTANDSHWDEYLFTHMTAMTSIVLSGFYIKKTLDNKQLEDKKKNTLAVNQALVTVASCIGSYTLNQALQPRFEKFEKKFKMLNAADANVEKYMKGLKIFKTTVIFGTIYRFIAPVFATPIANAIGNKLQDKKEAKSTPKVANLDIIKA